MNLYECRHCGILSTERRHRCPACKSHGMKSEPNGYAFTPISLSDLE
jgi:RNA polymerase subunit RPABC4/transcription elongation factor Spt4